MNEDALAPDDPLDEIASCLARVRDHVYRANVGGLVVEAGRDLFEQDPRMAVRTRELRSAGEPHQPGGTG